MGLQVNAASPRQGRWFAAAGVLTVTLLLAASMPVAGQADALSTDAAVKAAFIFNFAKFAQWPALPARATLVTCVVGNPRIADALTEIVRGKDIGGHGLNVVRPSDGTSWGDCHVLFLAATQVAASAGVLSGLRKLPILTVSDGAGFARTGGIIELYLDGSRMRFAINVDSAERSGLRLSSRLLGLATVVRDRDVP